MATTGSLPLTGEPKADQLLVEDPLALLIGMLLDQQVPMEWAFHSPYVLKERLGRLEVAEIAAFDPEELAELFSRTPALHRFPKAMAARTQDLCRMILDRFDGRSADVWKAAADGAELLANVKALPGFGEQKARIFVALLGKRLGVRPAGWEKAAGPYGVEGFRSVADIDGPEALAKVREHKKATKAAAKAEAAKVKAEASPAG